jgi:hypothetical protein
MTLRPLDNIRDEIGFNSGIKLFRFRLLFSTFDDVVASTDADYLFPRWYQRTVTLTSEVLILTPNQLFLTQKPVENEVRLDHLTEVNTEYYFPKGTYAYTSEFEDMEFHFQQPIDIESFWVRLHSLPSQIQN